MPRAAARLAACPPNALSLILRKHGNRSESIPVRRTVGDGDGRKGNVRDDVAGAFRNQGNRQRMRGAQGLNNELFVMRAMRMR